MKSHYIKIEKVPPFIMLGFKYRYGYMQLHFYDTKELKLFSEELEDSIKEYIKGKKK